MGEFYMASMLAFVGASVAIRSGITSKCSKHRCSYLGVGNEVAHSHALPTAVGDFHVSHDQPVDGRPAAISMRSGSGRTGLAGSQSPDRIGIVENIRRGALMARKSSD